MLRMTETEMEDLIAKAKAAAGGQIHAVSNFVLILRTSWHETEIDPGDEFFQEHLVFGERVLRSFLATRDIRESEKLVKTDMNFN